MCARDYMPPSVLQCVAVCCSVLQCVAEAACHLEVIESQMYV